MTRVKTKRSLEQSQLAFTKFFFRTRGEQFLENTHHRLLDEALQKVERGEIKNLVINIPPRYTKTQMCVIDWMARCIALNPRAKFIHLSYSDELALDNSAKARETIATKEYQDFWPIRIKADADSKKKWYTVEGGGVYATAAGGAVTGFGAGSLADLKDKEKQPEEFDDFFAGQDIAQPEDGLFYGAIIIDDPIKVEDAESEKERNKVNKRLNSTIKSRRNSRNTPIIIIMQRLHEDDLSGFVLNNGMEEEFYHLKLPACDEVNKIALWPDKHTYQELIAMKKSDHAVYSAQYQQNPTPDEGVFFKKEWFKRFRLGEEPKRLVLYGAGDYAVKEHEDADATEQAIGGFDYHNNLYFLAWESAKQTINKSIDTMMQLVMDYEPMLWAAESGVIRRAMEPYIDMEKSKRRVFFKSEWLPATASKAVNAKAFQGLAQAGKVYIPYGEWGDDLIAQLVKFTGKDDKEDDKVDVCGIFGRLLGMVIGPAQYHDNLTEQADNDDYGREDDDDDYEEYRGSGIPIV